MTKYLWRIERMWQDTAAGGKFYEVWSCEDLCQAFVAYGGGKYSFRPVLDLERLEVRAGVRVGVLDYSAVVESIHRKSTAGGYVREPGVAYFRTEAVSHSTIHQEYRQHWRGEDTGSAPVDVEAISVPSLTDLVDRTSVLFTTMIATQDVAAAASGLTELTALAEESQAILDTVRLQLNDLQGAIAHRMIG